MDFLALRVNFNLFNKIEIFFLQQLPGCFFHKTLETGIFRLASI